MLVSQKIYQDLKKFSKNNIQILPLNNVNKDNNTKYAFACGLSKNWTNKQAFFKDIIKAVKKGITGYAIKTGKKSGIIVIDYDEKENNNPEILEQLKATNTLTVKSPNGLHFYFKYNDLLYKGTTRIFNCYDIRTNGNCCFYGERIDGNYEILDENADILECPKNIAETLYQEANSYKLTDEDIKNNKSTSTPSKLITSKTKLTDVNKHQYIQNKYFITDCSLLYILQQLPTVYNDKFEEWILISAILKKYGYENIWITWSKKSTNYNETQNKYLFSKIDITKVKADLNYIIYLINKSLPKCQNKFSRIEVIHKEYDELRCNELENIAKKVNTKYIKEEYFNNVCKNMVLLIQSGLATGKTFTTFKTCIENNMKVLSIVHLISLCDNQIHTYNTIIKDNFKKNNPEYDYIHHSNFMKSYTGNFIDGSNAICSTLDSLVKTVEKIDIEEYYIYIDEVHRVISYLLQSNTFKKRKEVFTTFSYILKNCKGVIGTDGDIDNITYDFFHNTLNMEIEFYQNEYKSFQDVPVKFYNNHKSLIHIMKKYIKNNRCFTICCNTKKDTEKVQAIMVQQDIPLDKIKTYTSTSGENVGNVNEEWEDHYVNYSPKIVEGVDRTSKTPEIVFAFVSSEATLTPEQVKQQICRNRNIQEVHIGFEKMKNILQYNTLEDTKDYLLNSIDVFHNNFKQLLDTETSSTEIQLKETVFTDLYIKSTYRNNILNSNFQYMLCSILEKSGFNVDYKYNNDDFDKTDNKNKKDIQLICDDIDEKIFQDYINNTLPPSNIFHKVIEDRKDICNILTTDDTILFKHILTDKKLFDAYLNVRMLVKNSDELDEKIKEDKSKEYIVAYCKDTAPIIKKYLEIIEKYLPEINPYTYKYSSDDEFTKHLIEVEDNDFNYIKQVIKTKKSKPNTKGGLLNLLNFYVKKIYGDSLLLSYKKNVRVGKKVMTKYTYCLDKCQLAIIFKLLRKTVIPEKTKPIFLDVSGYNKEVALNYFETGKYFNTELLLLPPELQL